MIAIFKRDFKSFFISPIGYILIGGFLFVMNFFFKLYNIDMAYADLSPLFSVIMVVLMFIMPLITMKLFSEEYKMKTDQLILTSPVSVNAVVLGKFLAALSMFGIILAGTLFWPVIITAFGAPDFANIIGNYVAIIFAAASFISIGLFISSLTENQIVSAFLSFAIFLLLYIMGLISQSTSIIWAKTLFDWISLFTRYQDFTRGLFSLQNIVYYLTVSIVFLFLTSRVLEKKRWS
ncbi:MAG: ABC transporter permease [Clostridiales bacterium]|nr:ABC transporter permease [Clostridiales bacterium]